MVFTKPSIYIWFPFSDKEYPILTWFITSLTGLVRAFLKTDKPKSIFFDHKLNSAEMLMILSIDSGKYIIPKPSVCEFVSGFVNVPKEPLNICLYFGLLTMSVPPGTPFT